jgi:hypothetical protein
VIAERTRSLSVGVSTSSCPNLRASEIAEAVLSCGGDSVELRIGKGHGWESDGVLAVADAGVTVTAIASSRTFGADAMPESDEDVNQAESICTCLRCFLDARYAGDEKVTRRAHVQVAAVQRALGDNGAVVVEPHPGYASVPDVAAFCASTGANAVLDTLAVHRLGIAMPQAFSELGGTTCVLHVKGFEQERDRGWSHRALARGDLPDLAALAYAPGLAVVVVETRAGSQWRDLRLLREWAERHVISAAAHREEETMTKGDECVRGR